MKLDTEVVQQALENLRRKTIMEEWQYSQVDDRFSIYIKKTFVSRELSDPEKAFKLQQKGVKFLYEIKTSGYIGPESWLEIEIAFTDQHVISALARNLFEYPVITNEIASEVATYLNKNTPKGMQKWKVERWDATRSREEAYFLSFDIDLSQLDEGVKNKFLAMMGDPNSIEYDQEAKEIQITNAFEIEFLRSKLSKQLFINAQKERLDGFFVKKNVDFEGNCYPEIVDVKRDQPGL